MLTLACVLVWVVLAYASFKADQIAVDTHARLLAQTRAWSRSQ